MHSAFWLIAFRFIVKACLILHNLMRILYPGPQNQLLDKAEKAYHDLTDVEAVCEALADTDADDRIPSPTLSSSIEESK